MSCPQCEPIGLFEEFFVQGTKIRCIHVSFAMTPRLLCSSLSEGKAITKYLLISQSEHQLDTSWAQLNKLP